MGNAIRTEKAKSDLAAIWEYIAQDDSRAATKFLRKLDEKIRVLSDSPMIGRDRSGDLLVAGLRSFPVDNYVIFYCTLDAESDQVVIVRVFHAARDIENMLGE
jgi:toxin ParE1/3/4